VATQVAATGTDQTHVILPPGIMKAGGAYVISVFARQSRGTAPQRLELWTHSANILSAIIRP
jgi:hypothetical protein